MTTPEGAESEPRPQLWVVDSSSVICVREKYSAAKEKQVFDQLSDYANRGKMLFPPEVCGELERGAESETNPDAALRWVRAHKDQCERAATPENIRRVLAKVPELIDVDSPNEQADPYVLAVAVDLQISGFRVCIITDDRKDKPKKLSLATAGGIFMVATVPLLGFMRGEGLLEPD